jgi:hypothetical protein
MVKSLWAGHNLYLSHRNEAVLSSYQQFGPCVKVEVTEQGQLAHEGHRDSSHTRDKRRQS